MAGKLPGRALDPTTTITINNISFGDNVAVNSSVIVLGNSTVNTVVNSTSVATLSVNVGSNVFVNTSTIHLGNSTVNTVIHTTGFTGNGAGLHGVNAAALEGNSVTNILTSANTAANTLAAAAFTNAVSFANNTFLPLAGGTLTGALTINATANVVANLAANNVTFRGDVQIDGNLVVSGTSVTLNAASLAVEDNMIYLNNGSQVTHPDLGFAGNYNDGSYKHAGFFRDATDGVWKVFDGYTPEPDASAFIDTSNASFRIAHFTANVITGASFSGNGVALTSINASSISSGTLDTARLPATVNVSTALNVGANVNLSTTGISIGNVVVNSSLTSTSFAVGGNTATFGTAAYVVANGNVGINTSSPSTKLHVRTGYITAGDQTSTTGGSKILAGDYGDGALATVGSEYSTGAMFLGYGVWPNTTTAAAFTSSTGVAVERGAYVSAGDHRWYTGGGQTVAVGSAVTITEKVRIAANGNFGIGNSAPADILSVHSSSADSYIRMNSSNVGNTGIKISYSGSSTHGMDIFYYPNNAQCYFDSKYQVNAGTVYGDIYFRQNVAGTMTTRMTIKGDGGNVGVGIVSPVYKLDVVGGGRFTSSSNSAALHIQSDHVSGHACLKIQGVAANTATIGFFDTAGARKGLLWYDTGLMALEMDSGTHFRISNATSNVAFFAANGNVGIGNTSPVSKLTVGTNSSNSGYQTALDFASVGLQIESANAQGQGIIAFTFGGTVRSTVRGDYAGNLVLSPKSGSIYYGFDASGANTVNHYFYSNSSVEAVRFAANGNVGVGTTSPFYKLDVDSTSGVRFKVATGGYNWINLVSGYTGQLSIGFNDNGGSGALGINQYNSSGSFVRTAITLDTSGNVTVAGTLTESSSITLKENLDPIQDALGTITLLTGYVYDRKDGSAKRRAGLIAEEVEQVLPNVVQKDKNGIPSSIAYTNLIAYLVESIKELKAEIDVLKSK